MDGKKTVFGTILLITYGAPHVDKWIGTEIMDIIHYTGMVLSTGGLLHKGTKRVLTKS